MLSMETLALARAYADKIKQQVGAGFTPQIVESLPTVGSSTILYLVLKEGSAPQGNIYDEYLWINGAYEHIGDTATTGTIDSELSSSSENPVQNKVIKSELDKKVDKVDGKTLTSNDFTTAEKTKLDSLENYNDSEIKTEIAAKQDIIQYTVMPEADASLANKIVQYIGNTTATYTQGLFYKCVNALTEYKWQVISVSKDDNKLDKPQSTSATAQLVAYKLGGATETRTINTSISSSSTDNGIPTSKAVYTELDKKVDKPTTVKEGLLGFNSAGLETIKEITGAGVSVESDPSQIPNNKALKEYVASETVNYLSKPTSNGVVGYMSGIGSLTYTLNTSMPENPTHSGVLTAKAVKDYTDEKSDTKVDKVDGKGLSTNDFTNAQKALVEKILETGYVKGLKEDINGLIQNVPGSNSNNVLYINTEVSATKSGIPLTQAVYAAIKDNETKLNKTTSLSADSTDTQYPTAKAVYDFIMALDASEVSY